MTVTLAAVDIDGATFKVPAGPSHVLYQPIVKASITEFTSGTTDGDGIFDKLMASLSAHLKTEYDKNRISGADYTKTYIELTQSAMQTALQFLLNREQSFWASQQSQIAAINGLVGLETSRAGYATARYNFETTLPLQTQISTYNLQVTLPAQTELLQTQKLTAEKQNDLLVVQKDTAVFNLEETLPAQLLMITAQTSVATKQGELVEEQTEVQRAQTMDTRRDGTTPIAGEVGKKKDLYTQQTDAYVKDSHVKAAKLFTDSWITNKTIDEGVVVPDGFTNASIDEVLTVLKTDIGA